MDAVRTRPLPLTLEAEPVQVAAMHYVYLEKRGSIPANAREAWTELHAKVPAISERNEIVGYLSLYKMEDGVYRAGVALAAAPVGLPEGLAYEGFAGGKYAKFVLRGSLAQLQAATTEAVRRMRESGAALRDDFNIEEYVTDPRTTPEDELRTHILFPVQ